MASSAAPAVCRKGWSPGSMSAGAAATTAPPLPRTGGGLLPAVLPCARLVTVHQSIRGVVEAGDWPDNDLPHADASSEPPDPARLLTPTARLFCWRLRAGLSARPCGWRGAARVCEAPSKDDGPARAAWRCRGRSAMHRRPNMRSLPCRRKPRLSGQRTLFTPSPAAAHFARALSGAAGVAGINRVEALGKDTYSAPYFFTATARTHRGEPHYGPQSP